MKELSIQLKLFIAEKLLSWAFHISPSEHKDGERIKLKIAEYFDEL